MIEFLAIFFGACFFVPVIAGKVVSWNVNRKLDKLAAEFEAEIKAEEAKAAAAIKSAT